MFLIEPRQAKAAIKDQDEADTLVRALAARGYRPLFRGFLDAAANTAGINRTALSATSLINDEVLLRTRPVGDRPIVGDLLFKDDEAFLVQPVGDRLHVWEVRRHDLPPKCSAVCEDVEHAIRASFDGRRVRGMDFVWKRAALTPRYGALGRPMFLESKLETKEPEFTDADLQAAKMLSSPSLREPILRLAQVGRARPGDATLNADAEVQQRLLSADLLLREYLVLCRQDSRTLAVVADPAVLAISAAAMRCSVCGRSYEHELVQDIYSVSDSARRLLAGSHWMTLWVTDLLLQAGVPQEVVAWNATAGQDELDIVVDLVGLKLFFELKDREFGLGDAYPFVARVNRYGGNTGVILTTDKVAPEARQFLEEQRRAVGVAIHPIEGRDSIVAELPALLNRLSRTAVLRLCRDLTAPLGLGVVQLLDSWMAQVEKRPAAAVAPDGVVSGAT